MSQIFKKTDRPIYSLVEGIDKHDIGLPELQRPYVWDRARVRDLFDSLYRGYPTGLIIFLENETDHQVKGISEHHTTLQKIPQYVVIDGQQRLTGLYASLKGYPVKKEDGTEELITISFNPIEETFKVADAGTETGQDWIYDIKDMIHGDNLLTISNDYIAHYKEKYGENKEAEQKIAQNIQKVHNIKNINFHCIEIFKTVSIEVVSEIFLRINSRGKVLNNSDFILTLMSVYREEGRKLVEEFSTYTQKKNDIVTLGADEVVRILIGVGFKRAKLEDAYNYLKAQRGEFETLSNVINLVINKQQWTNFLLLLKDIGFIDSNLVTQQSLVMACYIFYLIGMNEYNMSFQELGRIIKQYYIAMYLTQKYSSTSFESILGKDFLKLKEITTAGSFIAFLQEEINSYLTGDTWKITFPKDIVTSSIRSPLFVAYTASQIYFQNPLLFRSVPVSKFFIDLKDKEALGEKIDIDLHHIFPRQYLLDMYGADGIKQSDINQIANKVYVYNSDNKTISKKKPAEYLADFSKDGSISRDNNLTSNCIPINFGELSYEDFLRERRKRMLTALQKYVDAIMHPEKNNHVGIDDIFLLIQEGENHQIEFKASYRWDYYQNKRNDDVKYQVIKTIDAFLNTEGGKLFVGVHDSGGIIGITNDLSTFPIKPLDSLLLDIDSLLQTHFSTSYALIKVSVVNKDNKQILVFDVKNSSKPVYFSINNKKEFYIRRSASSIALTIEEAVSYIKDHFN